MQPATIREFVAHDAFPPSAPKPPHTSGIRFNGLSYEQRKTV
jgi:hypothetical protein